VTGRVAGQAIKRIAASKCTVFDATGLCYLQSLGSVSRLSAYMHL
jgi:hypothetical protein